MTEQALDTRPQIVNVTHYAGDTLTLKVTAPPELAPAGTEWLAQVRQARDAPTVDATFDVVLGTDAEQGVAWLTLPAAVTEMLASSGAVRRRQVGPTVMEVQQYVGEWDCQISGPDGADPVRTLAQGTLTLDKDVSKETP